VTSRWDYDPVVFEGDEDDEVIDEIIYAGFVRDGVKPEHVLPRGVDI
jgi:hypothetical protein